MRELLSSNGISLQNNVNPVAADLATVKVKSNPLVSKINSKRLYDVLTSILIIFAYFLSGCRSLLSHNLFSEHR